MNKRKYPVSIGNHCWIGLGVDFTKNAILLDYTIVGTRAVVAKRFSEEYTVIAGNPAKVVKRNVLFDSARPD